MPTKETKHTLVSVLESAADNATELCQRNPIVEDATRVDDVTILPISQVSIGIAGGASDGKKKGSAPAGAGVGISRTPLSLVIIKDGKVELMNASGKPSVTNALKDAYSKGKDLLGKLKNSIKK